VSATLYLSSLFSSLSTVYRKLIYYTNTQMAEIWDRWQQGETKVLHPELIFREKKKTGLHLIFSSKGIM